MGSFVQNMKSWFIFHLLMGATFLFSGLVINVFQLFIYLTVRPFSRNIYRRINYYLLYSHWSQLVALTEWWAGSRCRHFLDKGTEEYFGKEHGVVVMNHKYEVDWLMSWLTTDKLGILGNSKTYAKNSLSYLPVIGWGWVFAEMIFLERSWEKDRLTLGHKLDRLMAYQTPILLLLFSEGTRFTPEKHRASMEFAKKKNLPQLKHHLLPRTRGFAFSIQHLKQSKGTLPAVYNIQIGFPTNGTRPTVSNLLKGKQMVADMYVQRIPLSDIPAETEEECSAWLNHLYEQKDQLMEEYLKTGRFPGKLVEHKRRIWPLINWIFWLLATLCPVVYLMWRIAFSGNSFFIISAVTVMVIVSSAVYYLIAQTKANKGSSYGKTKTIPSSGKDDELRKNSIQNGPDTHETGASDDPTSLRDSSEKSTPHNTFAISEENSNEVVTKPRLR